MGASEQLDLFEPTGDEVGRLFINHLQAAARLRRSAEVCEAHGSASLAALYERQAKSHDTEADCLSMLADFERLAGLTR